MSDQVFDNFMRVVESRRSVRKLKPDPLPEGAIEKILQAGQWAMSGNNAQPWEFIVVTDPEIKKALWAAYKRVRLEYNFWMEQMRQRELRHPEYQRDGTPEQQLAELEKSPGFAEAPALIVLCGDGRKQWATVMGAFTFGRHMSHLTDGVSNACQIMQLAARALGLGSSWVTLQIEDEFKRILNVPDLVMVYSIMPVGYPYTEPGAGSRQPLQDIVHYERYDHSKHLSTRQILEDLAKSRERALKRYRATKGQ